MLSANKVTAEDAAQITGLSADQIRTAAAWVGEPKDGKRRRTMFAYEKRLIWGNDNYRTTAALANIALASGRDTGSEKRITSRDILYARASWPPTAGN
jgi:arsenite oxidase large subunit